LYKIAKTLRGFVDLMDRLVSLTSISKIKPHLRGENYVLCSQVAYTAGSPPLAWGKY